MFGSLKDQSKDITETSSFKHLKDYIAQGIFELHGEGANFLRDYEYPTILGTMRVKTHDASPDQVSTFYLNGRRLYKIYVDCTQQQDRESIYKMVAVKLDRESFVKQATKILSIPLVKQ